MTDVFVEFLSNYRQYKESEDWFKILDSVHKLDDDNSISLEANEYLHLYGIATRCYFYGGDYDKSELFNQKASAIIASNRPEIEINLYAENLYLYSAINRARADGKKARGDDYSTEFSSSINAIEKALSLEDESELDPSVRAKVYFNAGALYHDISEDLSRAKELYGKACAIFSTYENKDDYNRTMLRVIRLDMEEGNLFSAELLASRLDDTINEGSKTKVHSLQLRGKIALEREKFNDAYSFFQRGKDLADSKAMLGDSSRLAGLIEKIPQLDQVLRTNINNSVAEGRVGSI